MLEVDLEYPEDLYDHHIDYHLAAERVKIGKYRQIIQNMNNKTNYVVHYENLKLYESIGLTITKIHRGFNSKKVPGWKNTLIKYEAEDRD